FRSAALRHPGVHEPLGDLARGLPHVLHLHRRLPAPGHRARARCRLPRRGGRPLPLRTRLPPGQPAQGRDGARLVTAHAAWLPPAAFAPLGAQRTLLLADDDGVARTVRDEVTRAVSAFGGTLLADDGAPSFVLAELAATE